MALAAAPVSIKTNDRKTRGAAVAVFLAIKSHQHKKRNCQQENIVQNTNNTKKKNIDGDPASWTSARVKTTGVVREKKMFSKSF